MVFFYPRPKYFHDRRGRRGRQRALFYVSGSGKVDSIFAGPRKSVSDQTSFFGACSARSSDRRDSSRFGCSGSFPSRAGRPGGGRVYRVRARRAKKRSARGAPGHCLVVSAPPASQINAPPKPFAFISSKSRVTASLVTFPLSHHQYARSRADRGGSFQPDSRSVEFF